jgi:hypothetical protein
LEKILKHLPNGEAVRREVFDAATSAVHTFVRKANRQIRTTKEVFGLPKAGGMLLVVNDLVEVLSPEVIAHKIGELLRKRTPAGQLQFPEIEGVWILSETHIVEVSHGRTAIPGLTLVRDEDSGVAEVVDSLPKEWAEMHGMPYLEMSPELGGTIEFESAMPKEKPQSKISRQESWERHYQQQPYLRWHTQDELKAYFYLVIKGLSPGFLKASTAEDRSLSDHVLERWTHLLLEIKERGIEMRFFSSGMQAIGAQMRAGDIPRTTLAEIEAAASKAVTMEAGRYYTNAAGKKLRCLQVMGDTARLLLLDQFMGKTLEATMGVHRPKWHYYWPLLDDVLITALDQRFERYRALHPGVEFAQARTGS